MTFTANKTFKKDYNKEFKRDPIAANLFLLLCELANDRGEIHFSPNENPAKILNKLMSIRFEDPKAYQL